MNKLTKLSKLQITLSLIFGVLLLTMMGLTVADVIGRYLFNSPITGATEVTEILLVSLIFMGLPVVCLDNSHISADLVVDRFPKAIQPYRQCILTLFSAFVLAIISWRLWAHAEQVDSYNGTTNSLHIPIAPIGYFSSIVTGIAALITLLLAIQFAGKLVMALVGKPSVIKQENDEQEPHL